MNKLTDVTLDVLSKVGTSIEKRFIKEDKYKDGDDGYYYVDRSGSDLMFSGSNSAFHRPLDKKKQQNFRVQKSGGRSGVQRYSSDNLAASPGYSSFSNYRQNPGRQTSVDGYDRPIYGTGIGGPMNYGSTDSFNAFANPYSNGSSSSLYSGGSGHGFQGNVGYAPDYYIAERRQVELVPAPPPRIVQQPVPYAVPVDRPVPQPYPVEVIRHVPVDRPVPVPVPTPVPVDRPVPVPVPVPVPSPPPPPVCVPVPVAQPVPCYIPVGVPVPSPPPSPVVFEQSVTHTQRWITGSPVMAANGFTGYGMSRPFVG